MSPFIRQSLTASIPWNLFLLTVSGLLSVFALKCIAQPHSFVAGGIYGTSMLLSYSGIGVSIAVWYALFNIPLLLAGWRFLSRRFMLYTIFCIAITTLATEYMPVFDVGITDRTLAAVATGVFCGAASGIAVRSLGSDGGLTVVALILHSRYGLRVGSFSIFYNVILFLLALPIIHTDNVIYSIIIAYLTSTLTNYFMGLFNERKLVFIISEHHKAISQSILHYLGRGCTLLHGEGVYTGKTREVLLAVVYNVQLRRLEELVFREDPSAFVIIENTHMVLGKGFSSRRQY